MRKFTASGVAAAGLAATLLLTGCGGDGGSEDGGESDTTAATPGSGTAAPGDGTAGGGAADAKIDGTWTGLTDGRTVILTVTSGKASLIADGHACVGAVEDMGEPMLALQCPDGDTGRTMGTIESNDGKKLVISWGAGKRDALSRTTAGALPSGLPSGLPTP